MKKIDFIIVGTGVAGLHLAIKLSQKFPHKKIAIYCKSSFKNGNTFYAQGGIASVSDLENDTLEKHIQDTLVCGHYMNNPQVVKEVVEMGPQLIKEISNWGLRFDKTIKNTVHLSKEGGHSATRIVHYKDKTGAEIIRGLKKKIEQQQNCYLHEFHFVLELLTKDNQCYGISVLNKKTKKIKTVYAPFTILATGGIGHLYKHTTNPKMATGDGIAMANRAGAMIRNIEFVQFHPTAFYSSNTQQHFLISEAVRGAGAVLRDYKGYRFMEKYDQRKDLAPRDIVSQSIYNELKKSKSKFVHLDCTRIKKADFKKHFPNIYHKCIKEGINLQKDYIPVIPVQHYLCGGIDVNQHGESSIKNLFACGEVAHTGLHGANRLASNSLLEALVFAEKIHAYLSKKIIEDNSIPPQKVRIKKIQYDLSGLKPKDIARMKQNLQDAMQNNLGIIRNEKDLYQTQRYLTQSQKELTNNLNNKKTLDIKAYELLNMIEVGILITRHSLLRKKSIGCFSREN
jgi:L-aspartate oxidase